MHARRLHPGLRHQPVLLDPGNLRGPPHVQGDVCSSPVAVIVLTRNIMSGFRHRGGVGRVPDWGGALQPQRGHQGEGVLPVGALRPLLTGDHL